MRDRREADQLIENYPGKTHFVAFGIVQLLTPGFAAVSHFGSVIVNVLRDARSGALRRARDLS